MRLTNRELLIHLFDKSFISIRKSSASFSTMNMMAMALTMVNDGLSFIHITLSHDGRQTPIHNHVIVIAISMLLF